MALLNHSSNQVMLRSVTLLTDDSESLLADVGLYHRYSAKGLKRRGGPKRTFTLQSRNPIMFVFVEGKTQQSLRTSV